MTRVQ